MKQRSPSDLTVRLRAKQARQAASRKQKPATHLRLVEEPRAKRPPAVDFGPGIDLNSLKTEEEGNYPRRLGSAGAAGELSGDISEFPAASAPFDSLLENESVPTLAAQLQGNKKQKTTLHQEEENLVLPEETDPALEELIDAWPRLSNPLRAAIKALTNATI